VPRYIPREVFFSQETKTNLLSYIQNAGIKNSNDFVFLQGLIDELDELDLKEVKEDRGVCRFCL